jgi:ABC-type polysaccharide/polyol phosphate transport system ATPase subunit
MDPMIVAENVSKRFLLRHNRAVELKVRFLGIFHRNKRETIEEFWALRGVSATIGRGEAVGVVGRNGSGKSTFLKIVAGLYKPTSGRLLVSRHARIGTMIELGIGFHGELSGRENVFLNASIHGLSRAETEALYPAIVEYSGLAHFMDVPLKTYSSGMHMRIGFAIAANLNPDVLLLDEVFAVGDADFQQQCLRTVADFRRRNKTILFVSHSPDAVRAICSRVLVLEHGQLVFDGPVDEGLEYYTKLGSGIGPAVTAAGARVGLA